MSVIKNSGVDTRVHLAGSSDTTSWSNLDKTRLYSIGELGHVWPEYVDTRTILELSNTFPLQVPACIQG